MAGIIEEILSNKEDLIEALLKVVEGKQAEARVSLDGVKFKVGKSTVKAEGNLKFTLIPLEDRKK